MQDVKGIQGFRTHEAGKLVEGGGRGRMRNFLAGCGVSDILQGTSYMMKVNMKTFRVNDLEHGKDLSGQTTSRYGQGTALSCWHDSFRLSFLGQPRLN